MTDWVGIDLELMWNLLPQSVLRGLSNGEATYYLTLMSSAANLTRLGTNNINSLVSKKLISFLSIVITSIEIKKNLFAKLSN